MSAENQGCMVPAKVGFKPLTGFDLTLVSRFLSGDFVNDVASGSNPRFIGRAELPPIDVRVEAYGDAT